MQFAACVVVLRFWGWFAAPRVGVGEVRVGLRGDQFAPSTPTPCGLRAVGFHSCAFARARSSRHVTPWAKARLRGGGHALIVLRGCAVHLSVCSFASRWAINSFVVVCAVFRRAIGVSGRSFRLPRLCCLSPSISPHRPSRCVCLAFCCSARCGCRLPSVCFRALAQPPVLFNQLV